MSRNIKTLFNFDPPATDAEIREASLQFVRKLAGAPHPLKANEHAFNAAVEKVVSDIKMLLDSLTTNATYAHARALKRFTK